MAIKLQIKVTCQLIQSKHELKNFVNQRKRATFNKNEWNLFNSIEWVEVWLNIYWLKHWELSFIAVYHCKTLIAIAPFYLQKPKRWYQPRILFPLGQGEPEVSEILSEYCDILITPGYEDAVLSELSRKLKSLHVDQIIWRVALTDSNIAKLLQKTYQYNPVASHARYIIERANWSLTALSKNTRSRYKRSINQLKKLNARFCWVDEKDFEKFTRILTEYHQTRWQGKGKDGAFAHPDFQAFHQNFRKTTNQKAVKMSAIIVNGQPIAINYYLVDDSTLYFYQCGWDEENYAKISPGFALHLWSIEQCNHQYYDFMMGGLNDSYKAKFGCDKVPMTNISINLSPWKLLLQKILNKLNLASQD